MNLMPNGNSAAAWHHHGKDGGTKFQFPIFCMDPASSRITLGLGREKGGTGCWWSGRNLVSAEDDILGLARWPSVGDSVAFSGALLGREAVQASHS